MTSQKWADGILLSAIPEMTLLNYATAVNHVAPTTVLGIYWFCEILRKNLFC